jgi:hypothetical protein
MSSKLKSPTNLRNIKKTYIFEAFCSITVKLPFKEKLEPIINPFAEKLIRCFLLTFVARKLFFNGFVIL